MSANIETLTDWRDFYELTKPRVVALIVFTAVVGMFLAVPGWPGAIPLIFGTIGIGFAASGAAVFNHILDARIDIHMLRTRGRPLPQGRVSERAALNFASALCVISMIILWFIVNPLTAVRKSHLKRPSTSSVSRRAVLNRQAQPPRFPLLA